MLTLYVTRVTTGTQASLADLQARLPPAVAAEVSQASFRPNLVVGGDTLGAWQEDGWVGEVGGGGGGACLLLSCIHVFR